MSFQRGVLHGHQVDLSSSGNLHGLQGDNQPHHGHRGISVLAAGATPPPSSPPLVLAELLLSHILTSLSRCSGAVFFFPSPTGAITIINGLSLGQWWAHLGARWNYLHWAWTKLLTEATPVAAPLWYQNLATQTCCNGSRTLSGMRSKGWEAFDVNIRKCSTLTC